ncbi:MAG: hypothetical protein WA057_05990, partial [Candidatus Magasanikiibacteriota bacterium]
SDNDLHLVIEDGNKRTMIVEIPDPNCPEVKKSEFYEDIQTARRVFLESQNYYQNYRWNITGILFIDKQHTKPPTGSAENNIELHPIIGLEKIGKKFNY